MSRPRTLSGGGGASAGRFGTEGTRPKGIPRRSNQRVVVLTAPECLNPNSEPHADPTSSFLRNSVRWLAVFAVE